MRSSPFPPRLRVPLGLRAGIVIGVALALVGVAVGTATGVQQVFQQVLVINPASSPVPVVGTGTGGTLAVSGSVNVTASSPVPVAGTVNVGNLPSIQPVSGTVKIGDRVQVGGAATVIASGVGATLPAEDVADLIPPGTDTSAYREITLYMTALNGAPQVGCDLFYQGEDEPYLLSTFGFPSSTAVVTVDPAPPNVYLFCNNNAVTDVKFDFDLVGRTN